MRTRTKPTTKPARPLSLKRENVVRREKYATNQAYREMVKARSQKSKPTDADLLARASATPYNITKRAAVRQGKHAAHARVRFDMETKTQIKCFSCAELAGFLGRQSALISSLRQRGFIPEPDLRVAAGRGRPFMAYSIALGTDILLGVLQVVQGESGQINNRFGKYLRTCIDTKNFHP